MCVCVCMKKYTFFIPIFKMPQTKKGLLKIYMHTQGDMLKCISVFVCVCKKDIERISVWERERERRREGERRKLE